MDIIDFIAFFIYVLVFSIIFSSARKKIKNPQLRIYHKNLFWLKVFASFCYAIFVQYISLGDSTTLYYPEGHNLYKYILSNPSEIGLLFGPGTDIDQSILKTSYLIGYFKDPSNFTVIRLTAILCFFSFGQYMVVSLFFAMIAFTGVWRLYLFFYDQYPKLHKQLALAILYLPTFLFWSSGILKDPLSISALGWFTYAVYQLVYYKRSLIKNSLIILLTGYLFSAVKIYILAAYLPAFVIFLLLKNASLLRNKLAKIMLVLFFIAISVIGFIALSEDMSTALGDYAGEDITEGIVTYQQNYTKQSNRNEGAYFSLGVTFDGSIGGLAKMAPAAIVATLFRPFLWESRNISTLLTSFESLAMMLFTLFVIFKVGIFGFIRGIFKNPLALYCFFFSIAFALFVGATTLNFGTLIRYKIPAMPFYVISLFVVLYDKEKLPFQKKEKVIATNKVISE